MNKFCLITVIWGTICITIVGGCGVKTVDTKNVNQEMEKSKKEPVLDKKSTKDETINPAIQKSFSDKKSPSLFVEESLTGEDNMEIQEVIPSKEQVNPFFDPNYNNNEKKGTNKKFNLSEKLENVHFGFDQYKIDESEKKILLKNAEWLKHNPSLKVQLAGHCDERGTNNYNIALGDRRAFYVKKHLAFLGISENRLFPISYGEEKPACWEGEEKCWRKNRRVQFLIISD